ncbi:hypothetical protein EXIGLDRAFT_719438, partial [Exidia glandulosa HHB12029]
LSNRMFHSLSFPLSSDGESRPFVASLSSSRLSFAHTGPVSSSCSGNSCTSPLCSPPLQVVVL